MAALTMGSWAGLTGLESASVLGWAVATLKQALGARQRQVGQAHSRNTLEMKKQHGQRLGLMHELETKEDSRNEEILIEDHMSRCIEPAEGKVKTSVSVVVITVTFKNTC